MGLFVEPLMNSARVRPTAQRDPEKGKHSMIRRFEIETKSVQVRFYDDHPDNYQAQFTGYVNGSRLWISGMVAKSDAFYQEFGWLLPDLLRQLGCRCAELSCTEPHARLLAKHLEQWVEVQVTGRTFSAERELVELTLTPRDEE